ncbi:Snf7-domain-containing protein [Schizopora paradoxa]|uniref:Snf7-domain-containing protein n=1 Tax=Schizopora paradoxa TaxID=27342 RepID=A0A0H2RK71_9AGAM|nr:Snf7-domain-containing protein [Schizopora paradoxa]
MNIMEMLFGRTETPAEKMRRTQRTLNKAMRELDKERQKLEVQEKKLVGDIKKSAQEGKLGACKVMAKDLIRTRRYNQRFRDIRTNLQGVSLNMQSSRSQQQMAESMKVATTAMRGMSRTLNIPNMQKIMTEFERENMAMEMKGEMMSDAVDDVMDEEAEDEEEGDAVLKQVLDEIDVDLSQKLMETPATNLAEPMANSRQAVAIGDHGGLSSAPGNDTSGSGGGLPDEDDLQARLDALRRG